MKQIIHYFEEREDSQGHRILKKVEVAALEMQDLEDQQLYLNQLINLRGFGKLYSLPFSWLIAFDTKNIVKFSSFANIVNSNYGSLLRRLLHQLAAHPRPISDRKRLRTYDSTDEKLKESRYCSMSSNSPRKWG